MFIVGTLNFFIGVVNYTLVKHFFPSHPLWSLGLTNHRWPLATIVGLNGSSNAFAALGGGCIRFYKKNKMEG